MAVVSSCTRHGTLKALMDKYYTNEFTYNEYPHKSFWDPNFKQPDLESALLDLNHSPEDVSQLLFVNVPFCRRQCLFCICYTVITQDYARIRQYLESLITEIDLFRSFCERRQVDPDIREIHIGGGSPTLLTPEDFARLTAAIHSISNLPHLGQFALEVDPRGVTPENLAFYAEQGVNRLSFGIQDFDPHVQKAIGRIQPSELLQQLLAPRIRDRFEGVNFDILCGLPRQTRDSFRQTIDTVLSFAPDRIMLMFLNYCPEIKEHHKLMKVSEMPNLEEKWALFDQAVESLLGAGYLRVGFDHFALPSDSLARAYRARALHWNSLGYRSGRCVGMIGMGAGSLGRITENVYYQNQCDLDAYEKTVSHGFLPVDRGYVLTSEDTVRRDVIHTLRCYLSLDFKRIEDTHHIDFADYFQTELNALAPCQADGLVDISSQGLHITELGKVFTSHICGIFDAYIPKAKRPGPSSQRK